MELRGVRMMKNIVLKSTIYLLIGVSALIWFGLAWASDLNLSLAKDFFSLVPKVVSADLLLIAIFVKWGWKFKIFRGWLVPFPDLNGTWVGYIYSNWVDDATGNKIAPIPAMLTVKQTFFTTSYVVRTSEMQSDSYVEGFLIDEQRQQKELTYSYTSKPRVSLAHRSNPHDGACVLSIIENPKRKLKGRYWTERKTTGEMIFDFYSDELLEELPEEQNRHPKTELENRR